LRTELNTEFGLREDKPGTVNGVGVPAGPEDRNCVAADHFDDVGGQRASLHAEPEM